MEEVARYEPVYHCNSKDFKDKNKKAKCWGKKSGRNLIYRRWRRRSNSATSELLMVVIWSELKRHLLDRREKHCQENFKSLEWLNPHIAHRPSSTNLRSKSPAETVQSSSSPRSDNEDGFVAEVLNKSRINRCFRRFWSWQWRRLRNKRRKFACGEISSLTSTMLFWCDFPASTNRL